MLKEDNMLLVQSVMANIIHGVTCEDNMKNDKLPEIVVKMQKAQYDKFCENPKFLPALKEYKEIRDGSYLYIEKINNAQTQPVFDEKGNQVYIMDTYTYKIMNFLTDKEEINIVFTSLSMAYSFLYRLLNFTPNAFVDYLKTFKDEEKHEIRTNKK